MPDEQELRQIIRAILLDMADALAGCEHLNTEPLPTTMGSEFRSVKCLDCEATLEVPWEDDDGED